MPLSLSGDPGDFILQLNEKINWILFKTRADLILLELPEPLSDYSNYIHYDFGVSSFALSKALDPDGLVVCTSLNLCDPGFISDVCDSLSLRLGAAWWAVHVGNQLLRSENEPEDRTFNILYAPESEAIDAAHALSGIGVPAVCLHDEAGVNKLVADTIVPDFFEFCNEVIR